jgi:hypothetical protein
VINYVFQRNNNYGEQFAVHVIKPFENISFMIEVQANFKRNLFIKVLFRYQVSSLNEETTNFESELPNSHSTGVTQRFQCGSAETVVEIWYTAEPVVMNSGK